MASKSINYKKLVPADTFIGQYMQHMEGVETARAYDFFCALWLMSLALGRECVVARPRAPVYMNFYAIMVAESGITRKSTAVREAAKLAKTFLAQRKRSNRGNQPEARSNQAEEAAASQEDSPVAFIEARTTPEQLEFILARGAMDHGRSQAAIAVSELVTFLGREKYNVALPGLLTDLYDCPEQRRAGGTLGRGSYTLRHVYVNLLSASTPNWLVRAVNPDVIEGGFTSRCLFIVSEKPKRPIAWPGDDGHRDSTGDHHRRLRVAGHWSDSIKSDEEEHDDVRLSVRTSDQGGPETGGETDGRENTDLVRAVHPSHRDSVIPLQELILQSLQEMSDRASQVRQIGINDLALKVFTKWYNTRAAHIDPFRASFESREDAHVLRIAGYLAANDGTWLIQAAHIKTAIKVVAQVKEDGARIFEGTGSKAKIIIGIDKLREKLVASGTDTVSRTNLLLAVRGYLSAADLDVVLTILHELNMVQRYETHTGSVGRPSTHYRATKLILSPKAMEMITEQMNG